IATNTISTPMPVFADALIPARGLIARALPAARREYGHRRVSGPQAPADARSPAPAPARRPRRARWAPRRRAGRPAAVRNPRRRAGGHGIRAARGRSRDATALSTRAVR